MNTESIRTAFERDHPRISPLLEWDGEQYVSKALGEVTDLAFDMTQAFKAYQLGYIKASEAQQAEHERLVREIDVLINGEHEAAEQASLCDIVAQVKRFGLSIQQAEAEPKDTANTEITTQTGEHYWALSNGTLLVVMYTGDGGFEVCGPWECGMNSSELTILQHIPRPKGTEDIALYYPPVENQSRAWPWLR